MWFQPNCFSIVGMGFGSFGIGFDRAAIFWSHRCVGPEVDGRSVGGARCGWPFSRWSPRWMAVQSVEPDVDGRSVGGARRGWPFSRRSPTWMAVQSVEPDVDGRLAAGPNQPKDIDPQAKH